MSATDIIIIAYMVMAAVTAVVIASKLGGPQGYRVFFSIVAGVFWPIPAALLLWLYIEGTIITLVDYITKKKK